MAETQYVIDPYTIFKTVVADNDSMDSQEALRNARQIMSRIDVNIFQEEYSLFYQATKWAAKNEAPLTRDILQQLLMNSAADILNSPKITMARDLNSEERFNHILQYTIATYDDMMDEDVDSRALKGDMNLYIQTWANQQTQKLIYDMSLIQQGELRVGNKIYRGYEDANKYYRKAYSLIEALVNERKDFLADDIDTLTMDGVEIYDRIREAEMETEYVSKFGIPSIDNEIIGLKRGELVVVQGASGAGKAIDVNTVLETPNGQVYARDVKVGDVLFSRLGKSTEVFGVFPQGLTERYLVKLSDGREMVLSPDHLVAYIDDLGNLANKELKTMLYVDEDGITLNNLYKVPVSAKVEFNTGAKFDGIQWGVLTFNRYSDVDTRLGLVKSMVKSLNLGVIYKQVDNYIYDLGNVPDELLGDLVWLARSLGYVVNQNGNHISIYTKDLLFDDEDMGNIEVFDYKVHLGDNYSIISSEYVFIDEVVKLDDGETVCFSVGNDEHLFLMNDFIVTHNTRFTAGTVAYNALMMGKNVAHISLEQVPTRVYPIYQARHIVSHMGTIANLTDTQILKGTYDPNHEGLIQESFVDLAGNTEYGKLKIVGRDLRLDNFDDYLNELYEEFPFDVLIIDYFGLIGTSNAASRYAELAEFANKLKSACKYFRGQGFLGVIPNQITKEVEAKLLKGDDKESRLGGAGSQDLLRGSDITLTIYETEQMKDDAILKLRVDKLRSGSMIPDLFLDVDKGRSLFMERESEDSDDLL